MRLAFDRFPISVWPEADRRLWEAACRPGYRFDRGGAAGHMRQTTRADLAKRYGYFLDFIQRTGGHQADPPAAAQVTPKQVEAYLSDLKGRGLSSVTVHGSIYNSPRGRNPGSSSRLRLVARDRKGPRPRKATGRKSSQDCQF